MRKKQSVLMEKSPYFPQAKEIANRLFKFRVDKNKTVQEIVLKLELKGVTISPQSYSRMENGEILFRLDIIMALCEIFNTSYSYIFTGKSTTESLNQNIKDAIKKSILLAESLLDLLKRL